MSRIAVSVKTAARMVDLHEETIRAAIYAEQLTARKIGARWSIKVADLEAWHDALPTHQEEVENS